MAVLDTDGNGSLSAAEIKMAATSLIKLDKDGDGEIGDQEARPPREAMHGRGEHGPGEHGRGEGRPGEGGRGQGGPGRGGPGGPGGPGGFGGGPGGPGQGAGGPAEDPARFVDHAMEFDADKDGKLSREELTAMAKDMRQHGPGGQGRGAEGRGAEGRGGQGRGGRGGPGGGGAEGDRGSERPRRPGFDQ